MTYYKNQLAALTLGEFAPSIVIKSNGTKTNYLAINAESAPILIEWLEQFKAPEPFKIEWARVNNDINGNPRFVCHYLTLSNDYERAIKIANSLGGRKYDNKQYRGGLVFSYYNSQNMNKALLEIKEN